MNKRKVLSILLLALITVTLAVSCSGSIDAPVQDAEELAYVTFGNGYSRGLSTSYETEPYNLLYWFYTAEKDDAYGTTGETSVQTPVSKVEDTPIQGLSGQVGPFSQGAWKFKLYAYGYTKTGEDDNATYTMNDKLVYESDAVSVTLKGNEVKNVPVSVSTRGETGYVRLNDVTFNWYGNNGGTAAPTGKLVFKGSNPDHNFVFASVFQRVEGTNTFKITGSIPYKTANYFDIPADFYTVTATVYLKQAADSTNNQVAIDNEGTPLFSQTFGLRVYGNATTVISGNIIEGITSEVTFDVADQTMKVFTLDKTSSDHSTRVSVAVTALNGNKESAESVAETEKTTVTFPDGALSDAVHQLDVAVTPIASAEQKFQASGTLNGQTAVSGIDLTMVKVEEKNGSLTQTPVTTFNDKSVTVTTYIATGLSNVTVRYLNNGVLSDNGITDINYNSESGLLTFKTTHFSQYVVVASVEALNVSTGVPYATLASAIEGAGDGQEIQLKDNVNVSSVITVDKNLTIDLNEKNITGTSTRIFHVTAGTLELAGTGNVTSNGPNTESFSDSSSVIRVGNNGSISPKIKAGLVVGSGVTINGPASYGVTVFGSQTVETVVVNGTITSLSGAVSGNGIQAYGGTTIIINNRAVLSADNGSGIYHPQSGDLIINGGSISGTTGIEIKSGNASVSVSGNPVITATGNIDHSASSNGNSSSGYSVAVVKNSSYTGDVTVEIESGTFTGPVCLLKDSDSSYNFSIQIKGGTFSSDPSEYVAEGYVAVAGEDGRFTVQIAPVSISNSDDRISYFADLQSALSYVNSNNLNNVTISLGSGTFSLPTGSCVGKTITIKGSGTDTVLHILDYDAKNQMAYQNGATILFENMTVQGQTSGVYGGLAHTNSVSYDSCKILGKLTLYGSTETFTNCVFENYNDYSIWTWGGKEVTFTDCTFNTGGKALLLYGGAGSKESPTTTLNVTGCTFNSNGTLASDKAAIEIGNDYNATYFLNVSNVTVNGFAVNPAGISTGSTIWGNKNSMDSDHLDVTIDGITVY